MPKYNNVTQQSDPYSKDDYPVPDPTPRRWWLFGLPILPFILLWLIFPRTVVERVPFEVEVTEIVTRESVQEVTRVITEEVPVEVPVEVTRIVTEFQPITVTQNVTIEVTKVVTEVEEIEVTRVVTEYEQVEVTRVVEQYIVQEVTPVGGACARFNLEVGRDRERGTHGSGLYEMRELSGTVIATWQAVDGALDSGWVHTAAISDETIYVEVFFTPTGGSPILLEIVNPAPNTTHGWLTRGICHAIEIQFPA